MDNGPATKLGIGQRLALSEISLRPIPISSLVLDVTASGPLCQEERDLSGILGINESKPLTMLGTYERFPDSFAR